MPQVIVSKELVHQILLEIFRFFYEMKRPSSMERGRDLSLKNRNVHNRVCSFSSRRNYLLDFVVHFFPEIMFKMDLIVKRYIRLWNATRDVEVLFQNYNPTKHSNFVTRRVSLPSKLIFPHWDLSLPPLICGL